jgi:hypothetical protein
MIRIIVSYKVVLFRKEDRSGFSTTIIVKLVFSLAQQLDEMLNYAIITIIRCCTLVYEDEGCGVFTLLHKGSSSFRSDNISKSRIINYCEDRILRLHSLDSSRATFRPNLYIIYRQIGLILKFFSYISTYHPTGSIFFSILFSYCLVSY